MDESKKACEVCPFCKGDYKNQLAVDIERHKLRRYPDDALKQVETLYEKLNALLTTVECMPPGSQRETIVAKFAHRLPCGSVERRILAPNKVLTDTVASSRIQRPWFHGSRRGNARNGEECGVFL